MRRLAVWADKNRERVWFAFGLNLLILLLLALLMRPGFESNDDITMVEFVNGARGAGEAHIVFQNYLLGLLYRGLYRLYPVLPWYTLAQYFFLWISFSVVTHIILRKMRHFSGMFVSLLILLFFAQECYIRIQFTKTAGIVTAAAIFLLLYAVDQEKISLWMILLGEALGCVGSMLRYKQFFACAALLAGAGVYFLLRLRADRRENGLQRIFVCAWVFGGLVCMVYLLHVLDLRTYSSDPEWRNYVTYNRSRAQLADLGFPDYDTYEEIYQSLGLNRDAYVLYKGLDLNDPEQFPVEKMQELIRLRPQQRLSRALLLRFFEEVPICFFDTAVFYCFLLLFLLWLFWGDHRLSAVLTLLTEAAAFGGIYFYMYYSGRYLINRVDVGLWFSLTLTIVWLLNPKKVKSSRKACLLFLLMALIVSQRNWKEDWRCASAKTLREKINSRNMLETAGEDKEHLYLLKVINTLSGGDSYGPFDQMPEGIMDNICWLGGWETNSLPCRKILERYGLENPYRDMIGNESVYLIDNNIDLTLSYIHTYYDEQAQAVEVGVIGKHKVYQIH